MPKPPKKHPPSVVQENCHFFLATLAHYGELLIDVPLARYRPEKGADRVPPGIAPARQIWRSLEKYGRRLLETGSAWDMDTWAAKHPEWSRLETAGFFEDSAVYPADILRNGWGMDLTAFLDWRHVTGKPLGFGDHDGENDIEVCEGVLEDVTRDVRALLAAAYERSSQPVGKIDVLPELTEKQRAVLKLIPFKGKRGITGKGIVDKLQGTEHETEQSVLTSHIMPKLVAYYAVVNELGVGYYRNK